MNYWGSISGRKWSIGRASRKPQLYYALNKLAKLQLIEGQVETEIARDRTTYAVTAHGHGALRAALADRAWASRRVAQPFATWLGLSIHADDAAYRSVIEARLQFIIAEIAKERASLAYVSGIEGDRAKRGTDIITLIIGQLEVEQDWIS